MSFQWIKRFFLYNFPHMKDKYDLLIHKYGDTEETLAKIIEINIASICHQRNKALEQLKSNRLSEKERRCLELLVKSLNEDIPNGVSNYSNPNIPHDTDSQSSEKE